VVFVLLHPFALGALAPEDNSTGLEQDVSGSHLLAEEFLDGLLALLGADLLELSPFAEVLS